MLNGVRKINFQKRHNAKWKTWKWWLDGWLVLKMMLCWPRKLLECWRLLSNIEETYLMEDALKKLRWLGWDIQLACLCWRSVNRKELVINSLLISSTVFLFWSPKICLWYENALLPNCTAVSIESLYVHFPWISLGVYALAGTEKTNASKVRYF